MAIIKTKGLIIREVPYNDTDKMLTLLTSKLGKISVSARNSRKGGSRSSYGTQVLTYGEYVLFKGKDYYFLNGCDVIANFYELSSDIEYFTYAAHMLDMAEDACIDSNSAEQVLILLLYGLNSLKKRRNPLLISSAFALKLSQITGYPPHVSSCVSCNTKDIAEINFSFKKCGFICENCALSDKYSIRIGNGVAKAILYVLCTEKGGIYNFDLSEENIKLFSKLTLKYIEERMEKQYRKLDFLNEF